MNDFYQKNIKKYADSVKAFIGGDEYRKIFKDVNGKYLCDNYFEYFAEHTVRGKFLRAYFVDLFYRLFGGKTNGETIVTAAAFETFESAVLMHDDVIDRSETRRGFPSAFVALGGGHVGRSRAICLGDAGLFTSIALFDRDGIPESVRRFATAIFLRTVSGEIEDVDLAERNEIADNEVIDAYIEKTATYTVLGPSVCGALLAGVPENKAKTLLTDFSHDAGVAFQIKDDFLGIYGNRAVLGKQDSDVDEGKKSLLFTHFVRTASDEQKREFFSIYGKGFGDEKKNERVQKLFEITGSRAYAEKVMNEKFENSERELEKIFDEFHPTDELKEEVCGLLRFLRTREK